jgi:site-specific recombinase XerD
VIDAKLPNYKTAIVRDIFVFCCFTGIAYADVKKLTLDDIHTDEKGEMWIIDNRTKTGTQFRVKLLPVARQLVKKYSSLTLPGNVVFPVKDDNSMNMSLRHVARHAGLSFNPTTHTARHTFATTVTLSQGVPLETVSKMLGHKHITTTQIYAKITNDKIGRDMTALEAKIGDKFKIAQ